LLDTYHTGRQRNERNVRFIAPLIELVRAGR
jgi:hypothetical protein